MKPFDAILIENITGDIYLFNTTKKIEIRQFLEISGGMRY